MKGVPKKYKEYFKITCQKCGSDKVSIVYQEGAVYSEYTSDSGCLEVSCCDCKNYYELSEWEMD